MKITHHCIYVGLVAVFLHYMEQKQQTKIRFYRSYLYVYTCYINLSRTNKKLLDLKRPNGDNTDNLNNYG